MVWYCIAWYSTLIQYNYFSLYMYPLLFYFWYIYILYLIHSSFFVGKISSGLRDPGFFLWHDLHRRGETFRNKRIPRGRSDRGIRSRAQSGELRKKWQKGEVQDKNHYNWKLGTDPFLLGGWRCFFVGDGDGCRCWKMLGWLVFFEMFGPGIYGSFRKFGVASIVDKYCPSICRATIWFISALCRSLSTSKHRNPIEFCVDMNLELSLYQHKDNPI